MKQTHINIYKIALIFIFSVFLLYGLLLTRNNRHITNAILGHKATYKYKDVPLLENNTPIYIFFHMCNYGDKWRDIILEQISLIIGSGLYDQCEKIFYGCSCKKCDEELYNVLHKYEKSQKLPAQPAGVFENYTINELLKFSKDSSQNVNILYLHSKGVTGRSANQNYWRDYMMAYTVSLWKVCVNLLNNGYNTVGVNSNKFGVHYSGNFWWARSDYLKKLDYTKEEDMSDRYIAENKIMERKEPLKHINLGSEVWLSFHKIGLYSKLNIDHTKDYAEHKYYINNPGELDVSVF